MKKKIIYFILLTMFVLCSCNNKEEINGGNELKNISSTINREESLNETSDTSKDINNIKTEENTEEIEINFSELHTQEEIDYVKELALKYLREETSYKVISIDLADDTSDSYEGAIEKKFSTENVLAFEITCDRTEDNGTERQGYVIVMVRDAKDSEWYCEGIGKSFTYPFGKEYRKETIETFFGINEDDYEVISEENTLKHNEYGGIYYVKLDIEKEQMDKFITEIKEAGFFLVEDTYIYRNVIKNRSDIEYSENVIVYTRLGTVKRKVNDSSEPMTVESYVIYEETDSEKYVVYMSYTE